MTRTRIATGIAALAVTAAVTFAVPAAFAHGSDAPGSTPSSSVTPLPGTDEPEWYDIGTPPTDDGVVVDDGADAPVAQ